MPQACCCWRSDPSTARPAVADRAMLNGFVGSASLLRCCSSALRPERVA